MIYTILSIVLCAGYCLLMILYMAGWHGRQHLTEQHLKPFATRVSVIIPARNEAAHIEGLLRSVFANDYPGSLLEVILIDDFSEDGTAQLAGALFTEYGRGRVLSMQDPLDAGERINSYKKKALEIAIRQAAGDLIVTTDADCIVPPGWLQLLVSAYEGGDVKFIAAPVSFTAPRRSLLYYFQSLDFMTMQGITAASAKMQLGNMCNGANLAFDRKTFYEVGGYRDIDDIASGDDMLLMYKFQQAYPSGIFYLKSAGAIVTTVAQPDWRSFLNQRVRWSSKADKYREQKMTGILALVYFFNLNFLGLTIAGFFKREFWMLALVLLIIKVVTELIFLFPVASFYRKTKELVFFPILQPLHILYIITAGFLGKFGSYRWKGRSVK